MSVSDQLRLAAVNTLHATRALDKPRSGGEASTVSRERRQLQDVSKQFEALLIKTMLKQARSAENGNSLFNDPRNGVYGDLYDDQIAQQLAQSGKLGFADLIYRNLAPGDGMDADAAVRSARVLDSPQRIPWLRAAAHGGPAEQKGATALDNRSEHSLLPDMRQFNIQSQGNSRGDAVRASDRAAVARSNDASELDAGHLADSRWNSPQTFIDELWPAASEAARRIGTAPQAVLAVAALETGWGKHVPPRSDGNSSNNLFGIKAPGDGDQPRTYASTLEFEQGVFKRRIEPFRTYETPAQAVADFARLVSDSPRYARARASGGDPVAFVRALHKAGYATDPNYSGKLERVLASSQMRDAVTRNTSL